MSLRVSGGATALMAADVPIDSYWRCRQVNDADTLDGHAAAFLARNVLGKFTVVQAIESHIHTEHQAIRGEPPDVQR